MHKNDILNNHLSYLVNLIIEIDPNLLLKIFDNSSNNRIEIDYFVQFSIAFP